MGFRMEMSAPSIARKIDGWYNGTHKMYGYWPYEQVSKSFDYLVEVAEKRMPEEERGGIPEDYYDMFIIGVDPFYPVIMSKEEFETWIDLYIKDLISTKHTREVIANTVRDANLVKSIDNGEVCLRWI